MTIKLDARTNAFVNVGNLRVTWLEHHDRDWAGTGSYLRIQAYREDPSESQALHSGAELPVRSPDDIVALIAAIAGLAHRASTL